MPTNKINWFQFAAPQRFYPLAGRLMPWFTVGGLLLAVVGVHLLLASGLRLLLLLLLLLLRLRLLLRRLLGGLIGGGGGGGGGTSRGARQ